jgi:hypothetical protein
MKFEIIFEFYQDFIDILSVNCEGLNSKSKNSLVYQSINNSIVEALNEKFKKEFQFKKKQLQCLLVFKF